MIDRKDWESVYFNKGYWIMDHLQDFNLTSDEAMVVLVINFLNETRQPVTYEALMEKCHLGAETIEECFEALSAKGYLTIDASNGDLEFLLDGLLDSPVREGVEIDQKLIQAFQEEFGGKTFSSGEMERILDLAQRFDERAVMLALGEAAIYDRRNLNYIENILIAWHNKGLSLEDLEQGKR